MTDYFQLNARIDDRIEALGRTLLDPGLRRDTKVEELARNFERIRWLEDQRALAENLSVIADLAGGDAA